MRTLILFTIALGLSGLIRVTDKRSATLLVLLVLLSSSCTQSNAFPISVKLIQGDAGSDLVDAALEVNWGTPNARCCVLPADGGVNLSDECTVAAHGAGAEDAAGLGLSEPCLGSADTGSYYGRWTCGSDAGVSCQDNGLSCAVGAACQLQDVGNGSGGCWGVVEPCFFPWSQADR
jgi:hypothetical protein